MCRFQCSAPLDVEYWISVSESEGVDSPKQLLASRNVVTPIPSPNRPFPKFHPVFRPKQAKPLSVCRLVCGRGVYCRGHARRELVRGSESSPHGHLDREIKMAYRNLAKVYHPDLSGERTSDGRDFIEIHNAYATLSDPAARAVYDLSLAGRNRRRLQTAPFGFSGRGGFYPTRRWETDQCW
ncbi:hypothetical protein Patl1_03725 [Pistacia atlantica]|uniref:Uncharacterized protein n=1 Tax=Pistacia atlantica TaxID=434234 RepID=A0ACC1BWB3_9ROSI|nr:hypothetical protein Patl1_03725 [Pistacia atlantica]